MPTSPSVFLKIEIAFNVKESTTCVWLHQLGVAYKTCTIVFQLNTTQCQFMVDRLIILARNFLGGGKGPFINGMLGAHREVIHDCFEQSTVIVSRYYPQSLLVFSHGKDNER
jgi:hypothetical protein